MSSGQVSAQPFVLLSQPTLFDATRAPEGKHIAWAYCHVPHGSTEDMLQWTQEAQIERFASGFGACVLARRVWTPADIEASDANLVGGDIMGGAMSPMQMLFRPTRQGYRTAFSEYNRRAPKGVYLCSASTWRRAAVCSGMCGYNAARVALRDLGR